MSSFFNVYRAKCLQLAFTMIVKSTITAERVNQYMLITHGYSEEDVRQYKYYANLAGDYHITDTMMDVVSLDTLETIQFTKENLQIHKATARAYAYGSFYYRDLVKKFPQQEDLIQGILNPIDRQYAIDAPDGTILYYDTSLVEPQEENLIPRLQQHIYNVGTRWNVAGYELTDDYYPAVAQGVLYAAILAEILNLRVENCGTSMVHSFHIREYLASNGRLDKYMSFLTLKQQLFLYRNLRFIMDHIGTQSTFELLLQNIINDRNLPLARYVVKHRLEKMPEELLPMIEVFREPVNDHPGDGSNPEKSVDYVMRLENSLARHNPRVVDTAIVEAETAFAHSQINRLDTKVYESALLDATDSVPHSFEDLLLEHWQYYAATNRLNAFVNVTHPITGQRINLSAREAWITAWFIVARRNGLNVERIPRFKVNFVLNPQIPTLAELKAVCIPGYVTDAELNLLRDNTPQTGLYLSIAAFYEQVRTIYTYQNNKRLYYAKQGHYMRRGVLKNASRRFHMGVYCDINAGQNLEEWMQERGFDFLDFNDYNADLFYASILSELTQSSAQKVTSLEALQRAMLNIMRDLSSYSVQYIQTINSSAYRVLDIPFIKPGNIDTRGEALHRVEIPTIAPVSVKGFGVSEKYDVMKLNRWEDKTLRQGVSSHDVKTTIGVRFFTESSARYFVPIPSMRPKILESYPNE